VRFDGTSSPPTVAHWFGPPPLPGLRAGGWYLSVQQLEGPQIHPTRWMPVPEDRVAASPVTPEGLSGGDEIALIEAAASVMAKRRGLTYVSDPVKRERYREFLLAATNTV